ncbi:hypothetical protein KY347_05095 [Candidatus Woesearchaeota archaeon]|nr:hypothetical protein [Candidatus Woesearchaeota archaeon]
MKWFYAVALVLMLFVSACGQKGEEVTPPLDVEPTAETEVQPETEPIAEEVEAETVPEMEATAEEIRILGKGGFEPSEMTIGAGSAVTWINDDAKDLTIAIFKDGKFFMNSDVIKSGEQFEQEFAEKGSYEYWAIAYGVKAKIIVE